MKRNEQHLKIAQLVCLWKYILEFISKSLFVRLNFSGIAQCMPIDCYHLTVVHLIVVVSELEAVACVHNISLSCLGHVI
jgi:hypothetical protein